MTDFIDVTALAEAYARGDILAEDIKAAVAGADNPDFALALVYKAAYPLCATYNED